MPKLNNALAQQTAAAEPIGDFEPLKPGKYLAQLAKVEVRDEVNKYGAPQWNAEYTNIHSMDGQTKHPGRQWLNLTLPTGGKAPANYANGQDKWEKYQSVLASVLRQFFESAGYSTDSDTDEMTGEWVVLNITRETIQGGPRIGEITNRVQRVEAVPADVQERGLPWSGVQSQDSHDGDLPW